MGNILLSLSLFLSVQKVCQWPIALAGVSTRQLTGREYAAFLHHVEFCHTPDAACPSACTKVVVGPKVDAVRVASKLVNYQVGTDLLVSGDVVVRYVHPGTPYRWG